MVLEIVRKSNISFIRWQYLSSRSLLHASLNRIWSVVNAMKRVTISGVCCYCRPANVEITNERERNAMHGKASLTRQSGNQNSCLDSICRLWASFDCGTWECEWIIILIALLVENQRDCDGLGHWAVKLKWSFRNYKFLLLVAHDALLLIHLHLHRFRFRFLLANENLIIMYKE